MPTTRLWGEWECRLASSGTVTVLLKGSAGLANKPFLLLTRRPGLTDKEDMRERALMAESLVSYLNGGKRPHWLDRFWQVSDNEAVSWTGAKILAVGPMIRNNHSGAWKQDESDKARTDRAVLISTLLTGEKVYV